MTITYPRELPCHGLLEYSFELDENVAMSISGGLVINRTQVGDPVWRVSIATASLTPDMKAIWSAWKKSLGGGLRAFVTYDPSLPRPLAYPTANAPADVSGGWDGTADVTSLGASGALALASLPTTYKAKAGDRVGLEQNGHYGYYEVIEDKTAVAGVATLTVAPLLHTTVFTAAAVARLWRPKCQFAIDWKSWKQSSLRAPTPITFEAVQLL